jgi:hypothetical protein
MPRANTPAANVDPIDQTQGNGTPMNAAMTDLPAVMLIVHEEPDGASHPVQPTKVDPRADAAVSVTLVP